MALDNVKKVAAIYGLELPSNYLSGLCYLTANATLDDALQVSSKHAADVITEPIELPASSFEPTLDLSLDRG